MKYIVDNKLVEREHTEQSKKCKHKIIICDKVINNSKYRYCKHCGMVAHQDDDFSYLCWMNWCKCMQ